MIRSIRRTLAVTALVATAVVAPVGLAQPKAQAAGNPVACRHGGYVGYIDPATGRRFANQGTCVSFVRRGGTLVPVGPHVTGWSFAPYDPADPTYPFCNVYFSMTAGNPDTEYLWHVYLSGHFITSPEFVTDSTGGATDVFIGTAIHTGAIVGIDTNDDGVVDAYSPPAACG
jgi:hypothetical protein